MSEQSDLFFTEFVKREYGIGGKGLKINGNEYSVWFDETGMQIAVGHTVNNRLLDKAFLSWEDVSGRIYQLLKQGEYAPQSVLDAARKNALQEHAQVLAYMETDIVDDLSELVFSADDMKIFHNGYPEKTDALAEKLDDAEWLSELNERLEGLAEMYDIDKSIMRFHYYKPTLVSEQFQKFAEEVNPYQAREGFAWKEQEMFITQDEIDAFLARGGAFSEGRLRIYSFYLRHQDEQERTNFMKEQYGIGGQSHALSRADNSYADYNGKGLRLSRGTPGAYHTKEELNWQKVAKRVDYLIKNDHFLQAGDYAHMPEYERYQMAMRVINIYNRLPHEIERRFTDELLHEEARKLVPNMLADEEMAQELLQKMDATLAELPLDFEAYGTNYNEKAQSLSILHQYVEGTYTIFPTKELEQPTIE